MAAEHFGQLIADDLDNLLPGRKRGKHFFAHGFSSHLLDELLHYLEVNVGFEERHANLAESLLHIFGRQFPFAAQVLENALQLIR